MLFNRHLVIMAFSILFIGVIFWWQNPTVAITAMSKSDYAWSSYAAVKSYWKRVEDKQFDLAKGLVGEGAVNEHYDIEERLSENPLVSIQRVMIESTNDAHTYISKVNIGSVIDNREERTYLVNVEASEKGWIITSLKIIHNETLLN